MVNYPELVRILEESEEPKTEVVLPRPIEEIFPEKVPVPQEAEDHRVKLMKEDYETLVSTSFQGKP